MPTHRLLIEYDGTKFAGWQAQASGRTVQGTLLDALRAVTGEREIDLQGAGRTDAGVHALGQVASLRTRGRLDPATMRQRLDETLPADLAVRRIELVPPRFHARHDALARCYRYQIATRRSAFGKRTTWWIAEPLDLDAMAVAARSFEGRHDYRAFAKRGGEKDSTLVEVELCRLAVVEDFVIVRLVASHFLWNQVRRMVGALVAIGRGAASADDVTGWLSGASAPPLLAAPAAGLFLETVRYPGEEWSLPPLVPVGAPLLTTVQARVLG